MEVNLQSFKRIVKICYYVLPTSAVTFAYSANVLSFALLWLASLWLLATASLTMVSGVPAPFVPRSCSWRPCSCLLLAFTAAGAYAFASMPGLVLEYHSNIDWSTNIYIPCMLGISRCVCSIDGLFFFTYHCLRRVKCAL